MMSKEAPSVETQWNRADEGGWDVHSNSSNVLAAVVA